MIRLTDLAGKGSFTMGGKKFEYGKVYSNPYATAFKPVNEAEGSEDHEVSMGQNQLDTIIKMATELKAKMGENEKEIPAWIQDHISKAENYISQAAGNYHEYGTNESVNEIIKTYKPGDGEEVAKIYSGHLTGDKRYSHALTVVDILHANNLVTTAVAKKMEQELANSLARYRKAHNESVNESKFYAFFNNKKHEIEAKDLWDAKQKAITMLKVPKSKVGYLAIVNAKEHDGGSYRFESVNEAISYKDGKYHFYEKDGVGYLTYDGKVLSHGDYDIEDGSNSYWMSHSTFKGQKAFDSGKDIVAYFKKNKIVKESVNETTINEGPMNIKRGVPKMYVKYMAVQKKVNELEAKQKEMATKYFAEKELNKKSKMLQDLKKGTEQLASYRRNLAAIEDKYVTGLYADAEYEGE